MTIVIRSAENSDAEAFQRISSLPHIQENTLGMPYPSLEHWQKHLAGNGIDGCWHFTAVVEGQVAGILTIENPQHPRLRHKTTLGLFIDPALSRRGIGSALMEFCLSYSFDWLAARKIELEVFPDNEPAVALYKKFGFETEGLRKASALRKGQFVDVLLMGLSAPAASLSEPPPG
ncbi:GNAT family N-acetyltransferase [Tatumella morbirosei]|uniref:GNAT family N-acetyltransferase n=1 Tax=Tatumella morbirosei TaxID=642227 RepID=UPI00062A24F6|nr:GNAT family N-acetyltransferase [Tatumella morbirosei]